MDRSLNTPEPGPEKSWVWYSTVASAEAGKTSVLAVIETLLLTGLGFWLFFTFDWTWHLLFGMFIAPLFYLRTEASTDKALEWAKKGLDFLSSNTIKHYKQSPMLCICGWIILGALTFWLVYSPLIWLGVDALWASGIAGTAAAGAAVTVVGVGAVGKAIKTRVAAGVAAAAAVGAAVTAAAAVEAAAGAGAVVAGAGTVVAVLAIVIAAAGSGIITNNVKQTIATLIMLLSVIPGFTIISLLTTLLTRIITTLYFLFTSPIACLQAIPNNWQHHHFQHDSAHPPELLPRAEAKKYEIRFSEITSNWHNSNWADKIFFISFYPLLFTPALLFRYSMKMGAWLWLPLVWVLHTPKATTGNNGFVEGEYRDFWAHLRLLYSLFVLIGLTLLPLMMASELAQHGWSEHALGLIFLFSLTKAWTWSRALAALLAVISFFCCRVIYLQQKNGRADFGDFWTPKLKHLAYLRTVLSLFTLLITLYLVATQLIDWGLVKEALESIQWLPE